MIMARDRLRVGLVLRRLHDRADQHAGRVQVAVADLRDHVRVGRDRVVDRRGERAGVGHDLDARGPSSPRSACPRRRSRRRAPSARACRSACRRRPASAARRRAAGVTPTAASSVSVALACRDSSPSHHLRAASGVAPAATVCLDQLDRAGVGDRLHVEVGQSPVVAAAAGAGRAAAPAATPSARRPRPASGASGTRSGSGK